MSPRFTVLMPTHNRADVIGFAIESVLAQTEPDFELLIVGDGCTDATASVVASFHDERIRWFDLPKAPGFGYANRRRAMQDARGELVAFAAHDDLLLPDHLELLGQAFRDDAVEWAYSRPMWITDEGTLIPFAVDLRVRSHLEHFLYRYNTLPASTVVYRASAGKRAGGWPEIASSGDYAFWKAILGGPDGHNLGYVPVATTLHFRANWRPTADWGPLPLNRWMALMSASPGSWPSGLQIPVAAGSVPQEAVWNHLQAEGSGATARIREATMTAIDRMAWTSVIQAPRRRSRAARAAARAKWSARVRLGPQGSWRQRARATLLGLRSRVASR